MSEIVLNDVIQAPFNLFKEKIDKVENLMEELVRPLEYYSDHNTILTLLCGHNFYQNPRDVVQRDYIQLQKFECVLEKIAEIKGNDMAKFLNEFVGETNGCTLYMQSVICFKKANMQVLCEYGYDPTFIYKTKAGDPVSFSLLVAPYGGSTYDELIQLNDDLCTIYNKNKLDAQLVEKVNIKKNKI